MKYVAARYVPKFEGTYNATQSYENLSVVDNGMGTSYISQKPVPAGTPLTDTNYWALYGASSGAIVNLQQQIDFHTSELTALENGGKNIMFLMDSYGNLTDANGRHVDEIVSLLSGATCERMAQGGASLYAGTYESQVAAYNGDATIFDTLVFIGGANDESHVVADSATIALNFDSLINTIRGKFTNVKRIFVMCPGLTFDDTYTPAILEGLSDLYKEGATRNNCIYVENSQYILRNTKLLQADKCHPTPIGVRTLAYYTMQALKKGVCDVHYMYDVVLTTTEATPQTYNYRMSRDNGVVTLTASDFTGLLLQYGDSKTYDMGALVDFGTFNNTLIESYDAYGKNAANVFGVCTDSNNTADYLTAGLTIKNGHLVGFAGPAWRVSGHTSVVGTKARLSGTFSIHN